MKTTLIVIISLASLHSHAAVSDAKKADQPKTCAIRLSNRPLKTSTDGDLTPAYCSGTVVGPRTIVTAAHCLDDIGTEPAGNLDRLAKPLSFYAAFNDSNSTLKLKTVTGSSAIFYSQTMGDGQVRKSYSTKGGLQLTNHDIVVVQLEEPISTYDPKVCPRLPTPADCEELKVQLGESSTEKPVALSANFFESKKISSRLGSGDTNLFTPTNNLLPALTQIASVNKPGGFLDTKFVSQSKIIHLRKGDSGTGILMQSSTGPVVVGVQSAVAASDDARALFAQTCSKIGDARWAQVVGNNSTQTAASTPIKMPGQKTQALQ